MQKHDVAGTNELAAGQATLVLVAGLQVALFRVPGGFRAYRNLCPHAGAPVGEGPVTGTVLRCPWHGWEFDLLTGQHLANPACRLEEFPVEVEGDRLFVLA